jgi:hypothetical protein
MCLWIYERKLGLYHLVETLELIVFYAVEQLRLLLQLGMGIDVTWTILFGVLTILVASAFETSEERIYRE